MKPSHRNPLLRNFILAATICLSFGQTAHAALIYWDGAASASWATAASWSTASGAATPDPAAEPGAINDVIFNITTNNAIAQTVLLNGNKNALSLTFNNTLASTLRSDSGTTRTLVLGTGGITVNSGAGAVAIGTLNNGNVVSLGSSQTWINNSATTATINNTIGRSNGSVLTLASGTSTFTNPNHALVNGLIGTWTATGTGTSLRYVTKATATSIMGAFTAGTAAADSSALVDTTGAANYDLATAAGATPATASVNTIRYTGAAGTLAPGATSLTVRGLMNAGTGAWTIGTNPITIGSTNELVIIANSQDTEISSAIRDNGATASAVSYHGGGNLTLSGNNTFTNGLNIGAGKVVINNAGALNSTTPNAVNFNGTAGTLTLNGNTNLSVTGINSLGTGTIIQPAQLVENASATDVNLNIGGTSTSSTFYGTLQNGTGTGTLGITKVGTGTLTLASTNTYTGNTSINQGVLWIASTATLPGWNVSGRYSVASAATLAVSNAVTEANVVTMLGTSNFSAGSIIGFDTTAGNRTYPNAIPTSLGLTKLGTNALTLTTAQTFTGPTAVTNGILTLQNASALGSTATGTTVNANGRLELDGGMTVTGEPLTISGAGGANFFNGALNSKSGVNKWTGNITIGANDTRIGAQAGASIEVSGIIDSGASTHLVTFRPADTTATVIVSGANTYVGATTLTGGLVNASSLNSVVGGTPSSSFGAPTTVATGTINFGAAEGSGIRYTGTGETTDRVINLGGTTHGGRIDQSGSGLLKFTSAFTATGLGSKTLTLQGSTTGTGEIAAAIVDNSGTNRTSLTKAGTGTWTLSGTNSYSGATAVNAGTLKLDYATNNTNKLSDTSALNLGGGTLELVGGSHLETVSSATLTAGSVSRITRASGTAVLQLNAITRNAGASVDFSASGIATTDTTNTNGILGTWATINGRDWAANSTNGPDGLITAATYTDVDAQPGGSGSTVINTGVATNVRIFGDGTSPGNITFGSSTMTINSLLQANTSQSAIVDPGTSDTLQTAAFMIAPTAKALSIGTISNDGNLTALTAGGDLLLRNNSATELLTINSAIANNTSASTLTKDGVGTAILAGTNTYTGATNLVEGRLQAGSSTAFGGTGALVMSGTSTLDLGGFNGAFTNLTATAANTVTNTAAGTGTNTLTISALSTGSPALFTDNGVRRLAITVAGNGGTPLTNAANTFSGGLTLNATVRLSVNNSTIGSPGAIASGTFGRGAITVNGGNSLETGAQIWMPSSNLTLVNDVIVNSHGGMGSRFGTFRIGTNTTAVTGLVVSGNINANLADAHFGCDSTSDGSALLLSGQLTGTSGFRFFQSNNSQNWTTTFNNATANPNDYAGNTTINSSKTTLALGAANQIPNGTGKGNVILTSGFLDLAGFDETINGLSGSGTVDNVTLGTSNTLTLGDGNATGSTFSGVIKNTTGTLSLIKTGSGTQTLSGANEYSGTTTVDGGTLRINGNQNLATGAVQVNATLTGTGTIGGTVTVASGGTIAPGTDGSISSLNVAANTSIAGTYACDVSAASTDLLAVDGNLTLTGSTLDINELDPATPGTYVIASYTGTRTGTLGGTLPNGYSLNYDDINQTVELVVSAPAGYTSWATTNNVTGGETGDDDKDGISNLAEYALGLDPKLSNPTPGTFVGNLLTFTKGTEANAADDVTYAIETSTSLQADSWTSAVVATPEESTISYQLPANQPGGKLFARLKVTRP